MGIRNLVETRSPWFIRRINEYFMEGAVSKPTVGYFRPSGMSECWRDMQYAYIGKAMDSTFDLSSMKRMTAGTAHHNMWCDIFMKSGIKTIPGHYSRIFRDKVYLFDDAKEEFVLWRKDSGEDYPDVRGTPDWLIVDKNEEKFLIEWKSGGYRKPTWNHTIQWNLYAVMQGVKRGYIILEPRDTVDPNPFPMELDNDLIRPMLSGMRDIEKFSEKHVMVARDERCGKGWKPKDCPQCELCYSEKGDDPWT